MGKYASAVEHLIETNCSQGEDDTNNTPKTSNRTIDLSKVDFGYKLLIPPTDSPPENTIIDKKNQVQNSTELIPREIKNSITSVPLSEEYTVSIDGDYFGYDDVVNRINTMDAKLGSFNNGDINVDWFEVLDISSVWIQHQFISEGKSNSDILHEEDFDPSIDKDYDNDSLKRNTKIAYTTFDPSVETVYLEDNLME